MKLLLIFLLSMNVAWADKFYKIEATSINGESMKMEQFKGKTLLIVNIASQCRFTRQLEDLEKLHQKYKDKKFVVIGVPSNEFKNQTPESDEGMQEFCKKRYGVTFPLLKKSVVTGDKKIELYKYLTTSNKKYDGDPGWNFVKFLVNKKGKVVDRFTSLINPSSESIKTAIEKEIK